MAYLQNNTSNKLFIEKGQIKNKSNLFDIKKNIGQHWLVAPKVFLPRLLLFTALYCIVSDKHKSK